MRPADIEPRLRANPLFREVPTERLREFAQETTLRRFVEGETLWQAGDPATHLTLLVRGLVQVVRRLPNGDVATIGLFGPREPIGTVAVLNRRPYPAEAVASSEVVEALCLRAEPVLAAMAVDPSLALAFNRVLCDTSSVLRARIDVLSAGSVPRRLATLLLQLADRFGDTGDDGVVRVPVALSRGALARLAVSLDGPDAATHDAFRGVAGSFAESLRILRAARTCGVPVQINTSVGPHNAKALRAMADLAAELGVTLWAVFVVVPTGRAGASLLLRAHGVEHLLEELADLAATAPFDVKTTAAPHFRRVMMQRRAPGGASGVLRDVDEGGIVRGPRGITDGVGFLFVSHTGEIYPSGFLPLSAGNVRRDDLAAVYRDHPLFKGLRDADALGGKCGQCAFRRVCGGSRARAWAMLGDVMAEDPLCAYVPRGYVPAAVTAPAAG